MATSDASTRPESDSRAEPSTEEIGESALEAARRVWYAWVIGAVALLATAFFAANRGLWPHIAEVFYAIFFAVVTLFAFGYGTYTVHDRTRPM